MSSENNVKQITEIQNLLKNMHSFFIKNDGQLNSRVKYYSTNESFNCYLTLKEAVFSFIKREGIQANTGIRSGIEVHKNGFNFRNNTQMEKLKGVALYLKFLEANENVEIKCESEIIGKINYLKGNGPGKWHHNLPAYEKIIYKNLWNNIDLSFFTIYGQLKYEFTIHPGANISNIKLSYLGSDSISLDKQGNLVIDTELGAVVDKKPLGYQMINDVKNVIESSFTLEDANTFSFKVNSCYDKNSTLVIDPGFGLEYSTYLGGSDGENSTGIAVDSIGNVYITGNTVSSDFPTTAGTIQPVAPRPYSYGNAFVSKIDTNASGSASLVYSTYLGGNDYDIGLDIAIDSSGNAYITGWTYSSDFPVTSNAYMPIVPIPVNHLYAFITKLSANGSILLYSTYLGGNLNTTAAGIAVDSSGNAYVTGETYSTNFPTTPTAYQPSLLDYSDAFVTKINTLALVGPSSLVYSTYLGGNSNSAGNGIAVDNNGNAYVTGATRATNFTVTLNAYKSSHPYFEDDAFVTKINTLAPDRLSSLAYSTYLGGDNSDVGYGITVDNYGNAYVTGFTELFSLSWTQLS